MKPTSIACQLLVLSLVFVTLLSGCANFHSLYFVRADQRETMIDRFRVTPRIFAYQEKQTADTVGYFAPFSVTVRVEDVASDRELESWKVGQEVINSIADGFLARAREVFTVDSMALHQPPTDNERILLVPDPDNFSPRRDNFFTLRFGEFDLPHETWHLRAVMHYHYRDQSGRMVQDSVSWEADRVKTSRRGLKLGSSSVRGYD